MTAQRLERRLFVRRWGELALSGWTVALIVSMRPLSASAEGIPPGTLVTASVLSDFDQPYVDRVLEPGPQQDLSTQIRARERDSSGWLRGMDAEYGVLSTRGQFGSSSRVASLHAFADVPNYGSLSLALNGWSVSAPANTGQGNVGLVRSAPTWRLDQRDVPLAGGWRADYALGDISSLVPGLARDLGRIALPSTLLEGASARWLRGDGIDLNAAVGRPGVTEYSDPAARTLPGGTLVSMGGQWHGEDSPVHLAVQFAGAQDVANLDGLGRMSSASTWSALSWEGAVPWGSGVIEGRPAVPIDQRAGGLRLQANWLHSSTSSLDHADGVWIDGSWRSAFLQNKVGLYELAPGLHWGQLPVANDLRGAYWQAETASLRWRMGWTTEWSRGVSRTSASNEFANMYGQYTIDSRTQAGATMSARAGEGGGVSLQLDLEITSDAGTTQLRASSTHAAGSRDDAVGIDQRWPVSDGMLSTSLSRELSTPVAGAGMDASWSWALLANMAVAPGLSLDAGLRGSFGASGSTIFANVGSEWRLASGWSVALRYTDVRGRSRAATQIVSPLSAALAPALSTTSNSRSIQLLLRYGLEAGSAAVPLGGASNAGAGSISGTVFFDANGNGLQDATEGGVASVKLVLDRRYVALTDSRGRYEFPFVVVGDHLLQIESDNIPLPWSPVTRDAQSINVQVRDSSIHDFALASQH